MDINNLTIKLEDNRQPWYNPIYSLSQLELEILKVYIEDNPINSFISPSKSPIKAFIPFDKKPDRSLSLYIYY